MADMITKLNIVADTPGEFMGRNANFSGEGFAENTFNVTAMPPNEFTTWIEEIKATADPLTEKKFNELLEPGHLGQMTFTGTHLEFSPPPEGHHNSGGSESESNEESTDTMGREDSEHSEH